MNSIDDIERLYEQALEAEIGDSRKETNRVRTAIYNGGIAFALQVHCIKPDTPPIASHNGELYYKCCITRLNHDMAMFILTNLKDVFPSNICAQNLSNKAFGSRRNAVSKELRALGISHMGQWITCCKDSTFNITIRHLRYQECMKLCKVLFAW